MNARKNSLNKQSLSMAVFGIVSIASILIGSALGQDFKRPDGSVPLPMDWSDRHVIYTVGFPGEQVEKMQGDPRYFVAMRLHGKALADENALNGYPILSRIPPPGNPPATAWESPPEPPWELPLRPKRTSSFGLNELKKDWSVSLGPTAGVAAGQYARQVLPSTLMRRRAAPPITRCFPSMLRPGTTGPMLSVHSLPAPATPVGIP